MKKRGLRLLIFSILFFSILLISGCESPLEELLEDPEYLAFTSDKTGNAEIYIMDDKGTVRRRLTDNSHDDYQPAWSPDGSEIAFISDRSGNDKAVYIMKSDGSDVSEVTSPIEDITNISWAPDGNRIIYAVEDSGDTDDYEIYYYDFVNQQEDILHSNNSRDKYPDYSPDGSQIVFTSNRDETTNLYIMDADGTNAQQLTYYDDNNDFSYHAQEPAWSPDGNKIAFTLGVYDKNEKTGFSNICTINSDGTNFQELTDTTEGHNVSPAWSADGSRITFASIYEAGDIFIMNADGTNSRKLTDSTTGTYSTYPAWAPANFEID